MDKKEIYKDLNKEQIDAINTINGNLLIVASAGTGKTTTIVERYINMVKNQGFSPDEVMMTTFTNRAARDMIEKIARKTTKLPSFIGTMHSIFLRILREHADKVLKNPNFTLITDESEKKKIIKNILTKDKVKYTNDDINYILERISEYKNAGIRAESLIYEKETLPEKHEKEEQLMQDEIVYVNPRLKNNAVLYYKKYQEFMINSNLVDFDDILLYTLELLQKYPEIREKYSKRFKSIMVDEAQDLNFVQIGILNNLMRDNLCLIGDDCQNIYEWRGSSNELVFQFDKEHKKIVLEDNYRSTENIIEAVNKTIKGMKFKIPKHLRSTREKGENLVIEGFEDFSEESDFIVRKITKLLKKGEKAHDIAVLVRTNYIGKDIEREFLRNKIPCHLSKSRNFLEREEIKDILSFLNLKVNPHSEIDFERVIRLLPGIGNVAINKIKEYTKDKNLSYIDVLKEIENVNITQQSKYYCLMIYDTINSIDNPIEKFLKSMNYEKMVENKYQSEDLKIEDKLENIKLLQDLYKEYTFDTKGIRDFLDSLIEIEKKDKDRDKVKISTIHSAKGLEWKHVFVGCCNEKILPFYKDYLTNIKRDSELRLFYVAISRAKDNLTLTFSYKHRWQILPPSQFLDIIEEHKIIG